MLSKLYKEPLKLNNKNQTTQLKKGKDLYRNLLKEDIRHISLRTEHLNNDVIMLHTCCNGPHPKLWQHYWLVRMWSSKNTHSVFLGNAKQYSNFARQFDSFYKTKHTFMERSRNHAPWYLLKVFENLSLHKNLHMRIYCSLIHNCQNTEQVNG